MHQTTEALLPNVVLVENPRTDLVAQPGQFFLAFLSDSFDPYLPQVVYPFRRQSRTVESLIVSAALATRLRSGELNLRGPYGTHFTLPREARRALVLAADALAGAQLLAWIETLVDRGAEIALLCGEATLPEDWLPPEVEYRVAADLIKEAATLLDWADALYACGDGDFYDALQRAIIAARPAFATGWAQILFRDLPMPCGVGLCYACAFKSRRGVSLNCQEGPVLDLAEWVAYE